ncbi:MAG TPA: NUDIX domain-containing protein [Allosphingosinicella sp.]|nr:NUDIX domain-containing protein [Allosphingosinicella sp.]
MTNASAGILMWRRRDGEPQLLLAHFGGPIWRNRDDGAWAIPKGLIEPGEGAEETARREFEEETGHKPDGALVPIGRIRQKGGKWVEAFALEGDLDPAGIVSNRFMTEWPPRSGRFESFPEIDRAEWFGLAAARKKILPSQLPLIDLIEARLRQ